MSWKGSDRAAEANWSRAVAETNETRLMAGGERCFMEAPCGVFSSGCLGNLAAAPVAGLGRAPE